MFVKMAVVVITIQAVIKRREIICKVFDGFANAHNLHGLFATNTCSGFKITLQAAATYAVHGR